MNDMPPQQDLIVTIKKHYARDSEVRFPNHLWLQMQMQMNTLDIPIDQFITTAVQLYINDLLREETAKKKWINFSEGQFFTSNPIAIPKRDDGYEPSDEDIFEEK